MRLLPKFITRSRGVEGAWVKDMNVTIEDGNIKGYRVNLEVTFQLEDPS